MTATTSPALDHIDAYDLLRNIADRLWDCIEPGSYSPETADAVFLLGERIGYGALMHCASALWGEKLVRAGGPNGGQFIVGPCLTSAEWLLKRIDAVLAAAPTPPAGEGVDDEIADLDDENNWLIDLLSGRDKFIVAHGLWDQFTASIPTFTSARLTTPATGTDEALRVAAQKAVDAWLADEYGSDVFPDAMGDLRTALGASGREGE